jgi:hypothetical protein
MHDFMQSLQIRWPVAGGQRIVDANGRQRGERPTLRAELVELRDLLLERTACKRDAEWALLERVLERRGGSGFLLEQPARTRILSLLVTPDAVVRLIERAREVHAGIGQRKSVAAPDVTAGKLPRLRFADMCRFERHELHWIELARRPEQNAALVQRATLRRVRGPRGIAQRDVELAGMVPPRFAATASPPWRSPAP